MTEDQFTIRLLTLGVINDTVQKFFGVFNFVVCKNVMDIEAAFSLSPQ